VIYIHVYIDVYGESPMARKTTILLREDVYQAIKEKAGARNTSNLINKILIDT
jgi:hypothetical protein